MEWAIDVPNIIWSIPYLVSGIFQRTKHAWQNNVLHLPVSDEVTETVVAVTVDAPKKSAEAEEDAHDIEMI